MKPLFEVGKPYILSDGKVWYCTWLASNGTAQLQLSGDEQEFVVLTIFTGNYLYGSVPNIYFPMPKDHEIFI